MFYPFPAHLQKAVAEHCSDSNASAISDALAKLYAGYAADQPLSKIESPLMALAYVDGRMPASVATLTHVLGQLPQAFNPSSILDLGSGTGAVLWALPPHFSALTGIRLIEQNTHMVNMGKALAKILPTPLNRPENWSTQSFLSTPMSKADLVTCAYVLNELPDQKIKEVLPRIWENTKSFLVLIEPGTPAAFEKLRFVREALIKDGAQILAPCGHNATCPMQDRDWCHFSLRHERSPLHVLHQRGLRNWEDEKYCYLIASKNPVVSEQGQHRILKKPLRGTGQIEFELCTITGTEKLKITKKSKALYKQAKRKDWGDTWP